MKKYLLSALFSLLFFAEAFTQQSVARQWNEVMLSAIREDLARPPVQARNLFHVSMAMYDAWAAYDVMATTYLIGKTVNGISYPFNGVPVTSDIPNSRKMAISYAAYRVLIKRFGRSPNRGTSLAKFRLLMNNLGYDTTNYSTDYTNGGPAALGNFIGAQVIAMGLNDGAREEQNFSPAQYAPVNPFLHMDSLGNRSMVDPNRWQPLFINTAFDQNNNPVGSLQNFVCPEWGNVGTFALSNPTIHVRDGQTFKVFKDPGMPPLLDTVNANDSSSYFFKRGHEMVAVWSSHLTPDDNVIWDISPRSKGNVLSLPLTKYEQLNFYKYADGGDPGMGYTINPRTSAPYAQQFVKRGDYTRVVSQYWADGPLSETPPGHWYVLLNKVGDYPGFKKRYEGDGPILNDLEWDVKTYFTLGGAMHDAAIACWGIKGYYDAPRPVSMIRKMAEYGQSSDPLLPSYHPGGIPLIPGAVELVNIGDPLAGANNVNVGKVKLKSWRGFSYISNPGTDIAGVDWILAASWMPYQRKTFVTPPFSGYVSGHSTYSRAASEVLTALTGDPYFPGGLGESIIPVNSPLIGFEAGPTTEIRLQWATYRDASDESSLSRIWGGIHPPFDDIPGRLIGIQVGVASHTKAKSYFVSSVVPIQLISFTASENNCGADIRWVTATEINTATFNLEKSEDGIRFKTIAIINASGGSQTSKSYNFREHSVSKYNFYRLVLIDKDGSKTYFAIKQLTMQHCDEFRPMVSISPNPAISQTTLSISNSWLSKQYQISIVDMSGKALFVQRGSLQPGMNQLLLQTNKLSPGVYAVKISTDAILRTTEKLVKIK